MAQLWGLDPIFAARAKLLIADIPFLISYPDVPGIYFLNTHPIMAVHLLGDVVSVCRKRQLVSYEVDDGCGVVVCTQWRKSEDSDQGLYIPPLGQLVTIQGRITEYREERQIKLSHIAPEPDPNAEPMHWMEVTRLRRTVYREPLTMPPSSGLHLTSVKAMHTAITECVLEYMKMLGRPVSLAELRSSVQLRDICLRKATSSCSSGTVEQELAAGVSRLPGDWRLVPVHVSRTATHYELLSDDKHMFPIILGFMNRKLRSEITRRLGVPEDWIVQHVRDSPTFRNVPAPRVVAAIVKLLDTSQIYTVTAKSYKCIT